MCAIGEIITIGDDIRVVVISAYGCQVKVGIKAPKDISIYRDEIYERILEENFKG
ncbi:MAG: carbon storage regulator [Candidatus Staskawiczbacteria bacterium]|nr:carbon storage regulator [Candidatus Staskawiczbacteria bacterium]